MARLPLPPTKSSLLLVKNRLAVAREGHDLLEQKRLILAAEVMKRLAEVRKTEESLARQTDKARRSLQELWARMGRPQADAQAPRDTTSPEVQMSFLQAAGRTFPEAQTVPAPPPFNLNFLRLPQEADQVRVLFWDLLPTLTRLAALRSQVLVLARELKKTQRRVNALEKIVIPQTEETRIGIENILEEQEREAFFARKRLKNRAPDREA